MGQWQPPQASRSADTVHVYDTVKGATKLGNLFLKQGRGLAATWTDSGVTSEGWLLLQIRHLSTAERVLRQHHCDEGEAGGLGDPGGGLWPHRGRQHAPQHHQPRVQPAGEERNRAFTHYLSHRDLWNDNRPTHEHFIWFHLSFSDKLLWARFGMVIYLVIG